MECQQPLVKIGIQDGGCLGSVVANDVEEAKRRNILGP